MGVLTGRPINFRRLVLFALVLSLLGGPGIPPRGSEAYKCRYDNHDDSIATGDKNTRECGELGCLKIEPLTLLSPMNDCALPPEEMKCLVDKAAMHSLLVYKNCIKALYLDWRSALKECTQTNVAHDPGPANIGIAPKTSVEVCNCFGDQCNLGDMCKCGNNEWGVAPKPTTTKPPPGNNNNNGGDDDPTKKPSHGHVSTVSAGVFVGTLGTLMILYTWKGS